MAKLKFKKGYSDVGVFPLLSHVLKEGGLIVDDEDFELNPATSLTGEEKVKILQDGKTLLTTTQDIAALAGGGGGGSPAGSNTQIQYNNAGAFGASSDLTFDPATSDFVSTANGSKLLNADNIFFGISPFTGAYSEYTDTNDYVNFSGIAGAFDSANSKSTIFGLSDNTNGYQGIIDTTATKSLGHITTTIGNVDSNSYGTVLVSTTNTNNSSYFTKTTAIGVQSFELGIEHLQMSYLNTSTGGDSKLQIGDGLLQLGNLSGGNGTKITIDDVNEQITISNIKSYDDDAAAGTAGLTAGMVYMTTGSGAAPLNVAGILMIKQ